MEIKNQVTQRMMDRWTLELANWLVNEKDMERREAFLKAHLVRRLLDGLGQGAMNTPRRWNRMVI